MLYLALDEVIFNKGIQKHTAGDDKSGNSAGNRDYCTTVNAAEHGEPPWFIVVTAGLLSISSPAAIF
jgi:hypothetical protein